MDTDLPMEMQQEMTLFHMSILLCYIVIVLNLPTANSTAIGSKLFI